MMHGMHGMHGMSSLDLSRVAWRTSSYSGANGSCVEVAPVGDAARHDRAGHGLIAVRDSKDRSGPALVLTAGQWRAFAAGIRDGSLKVT
ncbi:MAG: DUF397 domain-containing protein [Streptosporangiaceae bacterium]